MPARETPELDLVQISVPLAETVCLDSVRRMVGVRINHLAVIVDYQASVLTDFVKCLIISVLMEAPAKDVQPETIVYIIIVQIMLAEAVAHRVVCIPNVQIVIHTA